MRSCVQAGKDIEGSSDTAHGYTAVQMQLLWQRLCKWLQLPHAQTEDASNGTGGGGITWSHALHATAHDHRAD